MHDSKDKSVPFYERIAEGTDVSILPPLSVYEDFMGFIVKLKHIGFSIIYTALIIATFLQAILLSYVVKIDFQQFLILMIPCFLLLGVFFIFLHRIESKLLKMLMNLRYNSTKILCGAITPLDINDPVDERYIAKTYGIKRPM